MIFFHIAQDYRTPPQGTIITYAHILFNIPVNILRLKLQDVLSNEHSKTSDGSIRGAATVLSGSFCGRGLLSAKLVLGEIGNSSRGVVDS